MVLFGVKSNRFVELGRVRLKSLFAKPLAADFVVRVAQDSGSAQFTVATSDVEARVLTVSFPLKICAQKCPNQCDWRQDALEDRERVRFETLRHVDFPVSALLSHPPTDGLHLCAGSTLGYVLDFPVGKYLFDRKEVLNRQGLEEPVCQVVIADVDSDGN